MFFPNSVALSAYSAAFMALSTVLHLNLAFEVLIRCWFLTLGSLFHFLNGHPSSMACSSTTFASEFFDSIYFISDSWLVVMDFLASSYH
jgi:hypothetical protein